MNKRLALILISIVGLIASGVMFYYSYAYSVQNLPTKQFWGALWLNMATGVVGAILIIWGVDVVLASIDEKTQLQKLAVLLPIIEHPIREHIQIIQKMILYVECKGDLLTMSREELYPALTPNNVDTVRDIDLFSPAPVRTPDNSEIPWWSYLSNEWMAFAHLLRERILTSAEGMPLPLVERLKAVAYSPITNYMIRSFPLVAITKGFEHHCHFNNEKHMTWFHEHVLALYLLVKEYNTLVDADNIISESYFKGN